MASALLTLEQKREMITGIEYLDALTRGATRLRRHHGIDELDLSRAGEVNTILHFTVQTALPTFMFMKLAVVIDKAVKDAWQNQFSGNAPRFDDQLEYLRKAHGLDTSDVKVLKKVRNRYAHDLRAEASWSDFDDHFYEAVTFLIGVFELEKGDRIHE